MCLLRNRELAFGYAAGARAAGIPAVVNGSDASDRAAEYLAQGSIYVIAGEVEDTLLDLCKAGPCKAAGLAGLRWLDASGAVRYGAPRRSRGRSRGNSRAGVGSGGCRRVSRAWMRAHGYFSLNHGIQPRLPVSAATGARSRSTAIPTIPSGAPGCARDAAPEERLRARPYLVRRRHLRALPAVDARFADAVEQLDAQIPFKMQSRCDLMTRDTVRALRRAGCAEVWMGAESGSQRDPRRHGQGHARGGDSGARENLRRARHSRVLLSAIRLSRRDVGRNRADHRAWCARRGRTMSASRSPIRCPARLSPDGVAPSSARKRTGPTSDDLDMMFQGAYTSGVLSRPGRRAAPRGARAARPVRPRPGNWCRNWSR